MINLFLKNCLEYFNNFTLLNLQFFVYGIFLAMLLLLNCKTTNQKELENLDLSIEKKYIEDSLDIPEHHKKYILNVFDKSENFCDECVLVNKELHKRIEDLESQNKQLNIQASYYRTIRNSVFAVIILLGLFLLRNQILSLIKRLI